MNSASFEVVVVGAGPAGLAAATSAASGGRSVALIDDNPASGGQIWRNDTRQPWIDRAKRCGAEHMFSTCIQGAGEGCLYAERAGEPIEVRYHKLILATGARERFLPFPGWTLPGVFGAGGLQALAKGGLPVTGRRVVVAGSGPLLLAVAACLKRKGASVLFVAEQAPAARVRDFGRTLLLRYPSKLLQGVAIGLSLSGVPYRAGCWPVAAEGGRRLEAVTIQYRGKRERVACDYLACGFGLAPNTELPAVLGCEMQRGFVRVNEGQETSVPGVFCAGEPTGIGGVDKALIEGQIAGFTAAGQWDEARRLLPARRRWQRFQEHLEQAFELRPELRQLPTSDTLVCRCEDVPLARISGFDSWRALKLHTRCGMGPCQGRVCGPAIEFLRGFPPDSVRPPLFPISVSSLAGWKR